MLISLYRTSIKTKRWYVKVFFHCVDIAKVNAWLLYRRHCEQRGVPKKSQLNLLQFTMFIASSLTTAGTVQRRSVGRPSSSRQSTETDSPVAKKKCVPSTPVPVADIRYDNIGNWPEFCEKKNKCRAWNWESLL